MSTKSTRDWKGGPDFIMVPRGSSGRAGNDTKTKKRRGATGGRTKGRIGSWNPGQNPWDQSKTAKVRNNDQGIPRLSQSSKVTKSQGKRHT